MHAVRMSEHLGVLRVQDTSGRWVVVVCLLVVLGVLRRIVVRTFTVPNL